MLLTSPTDALKKTWGYDAFRPLQEDIIQSILSGNDTLAILPTGGGKSICYQVPALCLEGICLVISPLIALMKDQVDQLRNSDVKAYAIHSGMTEREIDVVLENCVLGFARLLYVSPERLKSDIFIERVKRMKISMMAVDEAHCISQWGYDFRPSYQQIAEFRDLFPSVNILALTASATPKVREDIIQFLKFNPGFKSFVKSFHRPKLAYVTRKTEDKEKQLVELLSKVKGTAIVYTRSRKRTVALAALLRRNNLSADHYHAGLDNRERTKKQESWMDNKTRIIVATNAFGMGINKPDVRLVIHIDLPDNVESYYQEAGRAGRDEKKAIAVIFYHEKDKEDLRERTLQTIVDPTLIRKTYQSLANFYKIAVGSNALASFDFDLEELCKIYNLEKLPTYHSLKKLEDLGYLQWNESFYHPSKVMFNTTYEELYKFEIENPRYEPVIKALLRLYGGELYSGFTTVNENKLARSAKVATKEIEKLLESLQKFGIITYDKQKDSPQVTFLTPRLDAARLNIDAKLLESRKQNSLSQMEAMISFVENSKLCRSLFLQHYFGEQSDTGCGICDICLEKKNTGIDESAIKEIRNKVIQMLSHSPLPVSRITDQFPKKDEPDVIRVIRIMLDSSQLRYDELNFIHLERLA
jgi:ATP-dependent DNA helicase RecQ